MCLISSLHLYHSYGLPKVGLLNAFTLEILNHKDAKTLNVKVWSLNEPYDNILSFGQRGVGTSWEWEDGVLTGFIIQ